MERVCPLSDLPDIRRGRAPSISMAFSLAADIFVVQGIKSDLERPRLCRIDSPPSIDWQPVSAIAGFITVGEGLELAGLTPSSATSEGMAWIDTSMNG